MEKREFIKRLGVGTFCFPVLMGCNLNDQPLAENQIGEGNSEETAANCISTNSETAGPYPTRNPSSLVRQDIKGDRSGVPMDIEITILNKTLGCLPLEGAGVDVWHCDKDGNYSEYGGFANVSFLRGRQLSDENGKVAFASIFPGWYNGRATHIHVHVYSGTGRSLLVTQIAFPEGNNAAKVLVNTTASGYNKGMSGYTYNAQDSVFRDGVSTELANISGSVSEGYRLTHSIVVSA